MKTFFNWRFSLVLLLVGFMIAVQYNTVQKPEKRDTRDLWAIRQELSNETALHSELLSKVRKVNETVQSYERLEDENPTVALSNTVDQLKKEAGFTEIDTPGIVITVEPSPEAIALGEEITTISPDLLIRLVNEANRYQAKHIAIDGKRLIALSAIRDINGSTTVNGIPVQTPPFRILLGTSTMQEAKRLYNHFLASRLGDDFYLDNLLLTISEPRGNVSFPAYDQKWENDYLKKAGGK